jgi:aconitate hydratase
MAGALGGGSGILFVMASLARTILEEHLERGDLVPGQEIALRVDQTLAQDATGTMACMQFELFGVDRVQVETAVVYVDHNILQIDFKNPDDHRFLQGMAARYGLWFSRPGNGICHYVHCERFAVPGKTLVGADSHTTQSGSCGMIAIGAGGLDVAVCMAGHPFELPCPKIVGVFLENELQRPWIQAKDVILELLRRRGVRGGRGAIFEFTGPAVSTLSYTERGTIANMIAELGATGAVFPADEETRSWLSEQQREDDFVALDTGDTGDFDEEEHIDLAELVPLVARPSSPGNVVPVDELVGTELNQVCIGSSVNSSYEDLAICGAVLKGQSLSEKLVSATATPGSRQILDQITRSGTYVDLLMAGVRMLEPACGPCVGMGQAPPSGSNSLRTFNRNFPGRSGTADDQVFLCSPAVAAASMLTGVISDPRELAAPEVPERPGARPEVVQRHILEPVPADEAATIEIPRGPNIKPPPEQKPLPDELRMRVLIVAPDDISTGDLSPDGATVMAYRSNVPAIAEFTFQHRDKEFPKRAHEWGGGFIVAGDNYGQGSSREHAALAPAQLGVRAVIAKGFARIHRRNLIAQGIVPLLFQDQADYDKAELGQTWRISRLHSIAEGEDELETEIEAVGTITLTHDLLPREREIVVAGGLIRYLKEQQPAPA